jgi:choline kinase
MKALIFAAGEGKRIKDLTGDLPKCLLELEKDKTILENLLDCLLYNDIQEVVIVVGYNGQKIIDKIGNSYKKIKIDYVWNRYYDSTNSSFSFYVAKELIKKGCLHFNADNVMHPEIINILINDKYKDVFMFDDITPSCDEDGKVKSNKDGIMIGVSKRLDNKYPWILGCGKLSAKGVKKTVEVMERKMDFWKNHNLPLVLCDSESPGVYLVSSKALPFGEVDTPEDLETIKKEIYPKIKSYSKK